MNIEEISKVFTPDYHYNLSNHIDAALRKEIYLASVVLWAYFIVFLLLFLLNINISKFQFEKLTMELKSNPGLETFSMENVIQENYQQENEKYG